MKRVGEDYTALLLGDSLPATSTPSVQRKVGLVALSPNGQRTTFFFSRMGAFDICVLAIGSRQGASSETRGLYGRRRPRRSPCGPKTCQRTR